MIGGRYSVAMWMPDRRGTRSDRWTMDAGTCTVVGGWLVGRAVHAGKFQARRVRYGTSSGYPAVRTV